MLTGTRTDVTADMERIFAPIADRAAPPRAAGATTAVVTPKRRRSRAVLAVVAPLGALAAVAIGYDLGTVPDMRPSQRDAATPHATRLAEPAQPVAQLAIPEPASATDAALEPEPAVASPADVEGPVAATAIASPEGRQRPATRPDRRVAPSRDVARDDGCTDDECLYRDVLAADRRLRRAYDRAARAGVSSDWLAGVNRRWSRARERAQDDPDGAIDRYERLADALDTERRELSR